MPERPTVATHAHTVAPGYLEIETGFEGDHAAGGGRTFFSPTVAKIGLASHAQLNASLPVQFAGQGQLAGLGDVALGLKWRLVDDNPILGDFAILPAVKFPTGQTSRGIGTGTTDISLTVIASYDLGGVSMDLNAGITRVGASGHDSPPTATALWTTSFGIPLAGPLSWNFEVFGYPNVSGSTTPSTVAILTGPGYLVAKSFNLDCGFITPLRGAQPNAIYAGIVWNVGSLTSR